MNKSLQTILIIAVLGLGAGLAYEYQQAESLQRQVAQLQAELASARAESAQQAADSLRFKEKVDSYKAANDQLEIRNKELVASGPPPTPGATAMESVKKEDGGFGGMMKKMFTDPEMKKVMRSQQAMGVRMMYGDLAKELGLAPDDAKHVMDLLADRQMAMTEKGMKMMESGENSAVGEDAIKQATELETNYDAQIEGILGKDGMAKMKEYERTIGDRLQMQQYKQAFASTGTPLDEQQAAGLLNIMKEERLKEKPSPFDPGANDVGAAMKAMKSEDMLTEMMASQEGMGKRVLARARTVLSPDQMTQFEQIQKQQIELQQMGLKMSRQFMKGNDAAPPAPAPPVEVK